jgi:3-oxoacyl-[acyl-carrier protein] reductase
MNNPMSMDGRSIVVTGAAQGIGLAISSLIIELGGNVVGVDLNRDTLHAAQTTLAKGRFVPVFGSVTDESIAQATVEAGMSTYGAVHGLVNNAGVTRPAMIERMSKESWSLVMDVHVNGSFHFTQAVGRHLIGRAKNGEKDPGSIVFVTSDAGRRGSLGQLNYSAAKSAMFGMTMTAAREWARYNIRVNAVSFGVVETAMTETVRTDERLREKYLEQIPLGRWSTQEEAAVPTVFLLSSGASYITGQILSVNGGYTIAV